MPRVSSDRPKKTPLKKAAPKRRPAAKKTPPPAVAESRPVRPAAPARVTQRTYLFAVGRRKEAVARVRWYNEGPGEITVNGRTLADYFPVIDLQQLVQAPLVLTHLEQQGRWSVKVAGGGSSGQAEAVRLGISRMLEKRDADLRLPLKRAGFLRRDPRVKERKKYGLKRARRAPQWQKR